MTILDMLASPFQFEFMRYALAISVLIAIPTALLSCFLVLKGWSLMGTRSATLFFRVWLSPILSEYPSVSEPS